ncbi:MAG: MutS-related protein [Prevotella sp.]|jgi:hypothetical protein
MELRKHYQDRAADLSAQLKVRKARNKYFIFIEVVTFIAAIAAVAAYTVTDGMGTECAVALIAACVVYGITRWADGKNSNICDELEDLLNVNLDELAGLNGNFSHFDDGQRYANPHHPYSFDLDIFGAESLFQRINRTSTTGGSDALAKALSRDLSTGEGLLCKPEEDIAATIRHQHDIIDRLAANVDWREHVIAAGKRHRIDTAAILESLKKTAQEDYPQWFGSRWTQVAIIVASVGLAVSIVLAIIGTIGASLPLWWSTFQFFFALLISQRSLHKISKHLNRLSHEMEPMVKLARLMIDAGEEWKQLEKTLNSWRELGNIVKSIDRRGNLLGLFFGDALMMNDIRLVARYLRWQKRYIDQLPQWIDLVSRGDALVSMATMRYNHPEAGNAEIGDDSGVSIEAKALWHPFLGEKAVRNDFSIVDRNFYIITGANMAGKSTFLRAVGINYVLAMNGMPVFAEHFSCKRFNLFSSMRTSDDLAHGISYFNAELLRISQLIDSCGAHAHSLIILDEILKGTNSLDKLNGSRMFLEWISQKPVSGIIATHDLELSKMEGERFHNYCFEISLGTKVTYSYKITAGVAHNQNASFLLKKLLGEK